MKLSNNKQGALTVTEYYNKMNGYWPELDHYQNIKMVCGKSAATLNSILERDRIVKLLAGLNTEYDQVRVQILGREKVPSLNEVFAVVQSEENRRIAMLGEISSEGSAMLTNRREGSKSRFQQRRVDGQSKSQRKEGLWCSYCKKPKHTQEICFKLHGQEIVLQKIGGFENIPCRNQAYLSNKQEEVAEKTDAMAEQELNADEINKLKEFLKTIQDGSCSIAQQGSPSGNSFQFCSLTATKTTKDDIWILDSGATDHMSHNSHFFYTYIALETPKQILIANGTSIPIKCHGRVTLSLNLFV